jgi:hypothetical protein
VAVIVNWATKIIYIDRSDMTLVSGTLYELDTNWVRLRLKDLEDDEGIPFLDTHRHNTEVTVAGVTYARVIEIINGYRVQFTPSQHYTALLSGSNNNFFADGILITNEVSVVSQNSAGLIVTSSGGVTPAQVWAKEVETGYSAEELLRLIAATLAGKISGAETTEVSIRDVNDTKDRVVATVDSDGNRTAVALDAL